MGNEIKIFEDPTAVGLPKDGKWNPHDFLPKWKSIIADARLGIKSKEGPHWISTPDGAYFPVLGSRMLEPQEIKDLFIIAFKIFKVQFEKLDNKYNALFTKVELAQISQNNRFPLNDEFQSVEDFIFRVYFDWLEESKLKYGDVKELPTLKLKYSDDTILSNRISEGYMILYLNDIITTDEASFVNVFSGEPMERQIIWRGSAQELKHFLQGIESEFDSLVQLWERAANCFIGLIRGNYKAYTAATIRDHNNKSPINPDRKKILNTAIAKIALKIKK